MRRNFHGAEETLISMGKEKFKFHVPAYLQRTGLSASITASEDGLVQIHRTQAYSIPFENFDIQLGRDIDLSPQALFEKMVFRQRGGYCFELNGLFLLALRQFGFETRPLLARVHLRGVATARTHHFTQTHPDHLFTYARVATLPIATGRVSLLDYTLRRVSGNITEVTELEPGQAYLEVIEENFGIRLDVPYESLKPVKEASK